MGPNGTSTCKRCKQLGRSNYNGYCTACLDKAIASLLIQDSILRLALYEKEG